MNYREMTRRERCIYHLKNAALAIAIGAVLGFILAEGWAK